MVFVITFCELLRTIYTKMAKEIYFQILSIYIEIISGKAVSISYTCGIENSAGIRTQDPIFCVIVNSSTISANAFATNNDYEQNKSEFIVSAPTPI